MQRFPMHRSGKPNPWLGILGFIVGGLSSLILCIPAIVLLLNFGWTIALLVCALPLVPVILRWRRISADIKPLIVIVGLGMIVGMFFLYQGLSYLQYVNVRW